MNGYKVYSVKYDTRYNTLLLEISYITLRVLSTKNPFHLSTTIEGRNKLQLKSYKTTFTFDFQWTPILPGNDDLYRRMTAVVFSRLSTLTDIIE